MSKTYKRIQNNISALLLGILVMLSSCDPKPANADSAEDDRVMQYGGINAGKAIVLVGGRFSAEEFKAMVAHQQQAIKNKGIKRAIIFKRLSGPSTKESFMKQITSVHTRTERLIGYVLAAIDKEGWDKRKDEFILLGYSEQGLAALEAAETLRKKINLTKVAVVSAPLLGYDYYAEGHYAQSWGPIGLFLKDLRRAFSGKGSTLVEELTPGSDYLKKIHAYIESQTGENDLRIYIADISARNLCLGADSDLKESRALEEKIAEHFKQSAKKIRDKDDKAKASKNPADLPDVDEFMYWWQFLEKTDKRGFYEFFRCLNGGKDHNGALSVESQRGGNIANPRVKRGSFDGYSGRIHVKHLGIVAQQKPLNFFSKAERTPNNPRLQEALLHVILE